MSFLNTKLPFSWPVQFTAHNGCETAANFSSHSCASPALNGGHKKWLPNLSLFLVQKLTIYKGQKTHPNYTEENTSTNDRQRKQKQMKRRKREECRNGGRDEKFFTRDQRRMKKGDTQLEKGRSQCFIFQGRIQDNPTVLGCKSRFRAKTNQIKRVFEKRN